jgi:NAD(P)-binding Rossmann-like domain
MNGSERSVVIGAGPNGLVAAIRLAEAGRAVTVLDAADRPGGAVRTEELTLPGFRHDTFSSVYPAAAASPVFASMPLERHGMRWIHPDACYAHPLPNGRAVALYRDLERTAESLDAAADGDGERWRGFVEPLIDGFDAIRSTMLATFPPLAGAVRLLTGQAGRHRQAVAAERRLMYVRTLERAYGLVVDLAGGDHRRNRNVAAAERLPNEYKVGLEVPVLEHEPSSHPPETGLDLVDHEQRAVAPAQLLRCSEIGRGRQRHHASLDRLHVELIRRNPPSLMRMPTAMPSPFAWVWPTPH